MFRKAISTLIVTGILSAGAVGCKSKAGTGAVVGGAGGALVGGIIGNNTGSGRGGQGALIGAGVGAIGGGLVGHGMDKSDEKKRKEEERQYRDRTSDRVPAPASDRITRVDVMDWSRQGVSDPVIIDRIQRSGTTFNLTASDEKQLRDSGVSAQVVTAMRNTSR